MIFISHNQNDKPLVEPIALKLSTNFGQDKIFYDSWSIQPGDGIIDKMNEGLTNCKFFFFFVSKNSLNSGLVKLEWQNALMKSAKSGIKFIPIKMDDCTMPDILLQNLYINLYGYGPEVAVRQIIDVINGKNTFEPGKFTGYQNIRAYISSSSSEIKIEFRAETYLEPQAKFVLMIQNPKDEFSYQIEGIALPTNLIEDYDFEGGRYTAVQVSRPNSVSPGFPFIVNIIPKEKTNIIIGGALHAISTTEYKNILMIIN